MRTRILIFAAAVIATPLVGRAQEPGSSPLPPTTTAAAAPGVDLSALGWIDLGFRGTSATGDVARLERYRDLRDGSYSRIALNRDSDRYLFAATAFDVGYRDQRYQAGYTGGPLRFTGLFDSIPLNYSYLTSTPWVEQTPAVLTLDVAARQQVQARQVVGVPQTVADLATASIYRGIANPFDLEQLRQTGAFSLAYDATSRLTVDAAFSSAKKDGHQPWGASFAFNVANEVPLALDNRTNDASAGLEWTHTHGMFRIGWNGSWFDNNIKQLVWDNAYRATDTNPYDASGYSNGNGPAQGRMAVPPSNTLNAVSAVGVYRFPAHTTLNGSVAFTRMSQDDPLIPWTINPVIAGNPATLAAFPNLAGLPRATAQASVDGVNGILNLTTRPNRRVGFTARYRFNNHVNNTPTFDGTQYVRFDAVPESTGGVSEQFDIKENLLNVDATFSLLPYTSFRIGYGYDSFDRTGRAFNNTTDNSARASVDFLGNQWFTIRALYQFTKRVGSGFSEDAIEEGGSQPGLRFYDEADRDRNRGTLLFTVNPAQKVDVTFSLTAGKDTYKGPGHEFGLLDNDNTTVNVGVDYSPTTMITVGANYGRDHYASDQKSRNANPPPDPQFTDPSRDWTLANTENVNNFDAYLDLPKLANKTNVRISYDFSDSDNAFLFGGPRIASLTAAGQFIPLPNVTNRWHRLSADVQYMFAARLGVGLSYWFEKVDIADFNTIDIPGEPGIPRIDYLGEISTGYGNRPYRGNTGFVRLIYQFSTR